MEPLCLLTRRVKNANFNLSVPVSLVVATREKHNNNHLK